MTPKLWLEAPDLHDLLTEPGPFLSLALATEAQVDNAGHRNQTRWRGRRDQFLAEGVDEAVLAHVDPLIEDAHLSGQTLMVVASAGGVSHVSHWPDLPFRELARWAPLPSFGALIERRQEAPPYVVVAVDRQGADLTAVRHEAPDLSLVAGDQERVLRKVNAGGWSQRRYHERAENSWEQNAKDVADRLVRLVHHVDARFVAVAGDVRALQPLREELPGDVADLLTEVGGSRSADGAGELDPGQLEPLLKEVVARDTEALVEKLAEEVGQNDRGRSGVAGTITALTAARVQVLLVHDDPDDDRTAWFGSDPAVVGARRQEVEGIVDHPQEGRLADVLVRGALATGAGVRMLPDAGLVSEGVGAILRWA